ncbi:MAG: hemolysin family protein [Candidatus Nanopelagicales bacterium]|nr:hemolysin family protein [Candidatus Nanopelagicales bacterium]
MSDIWVNIIFVLLFILLGGFFAAAEMALVTLRDGQVTKLKEQGRRGRRLARLAQNPNRFLAAGQVGVTLAGFVSAGFGAAQIAPELAKAFVDWGMGQGLADSLSFIFVTILIVYFSLVLGELVPKRIALQRVETVALVVAGPIDVLAKITRPFIAALSLATDAIVRLLGIDPNAAKESISGEELRDLVAAHEELSEQERELIDDVFSAGDRELREVMVPRTEVEFLDAAMPVNKAVKQISEQPHSRYPVMRESSDDIIGFVHIRDFLVPGMAERSIRVGELVREIAAYPGTNDVLSTLSDMRRRHAHMAIVVDEYGGTAGIVTMEDLVEELIGDIRDEYDVDEIAETSRPLGILSVDGLMNLDDFEEDCGITLPQGPYETVAGFLVAELGTLPEVGNAVVASDHTFTVTELDGRRIARIRVEPNEVTDHVQESDPALPE